MNRCFPRMTVHTYSTTICKLPMALPPGAQVEFANHVRNPLPGPAGGVVVYRHDCPVSPMTLRHSIETVRLWLTARDLVQNVGRVTADVGPLSVGCWVGRVHTTFKMIDWRDYPVRL